MVRKATSASRFKIAIAVGLLGALTASGAYLYWSWYRPLRVPDEVYVVKPGTSLRGLGRQLHERGVLADPYTFIWLGYLTGRSRELKAGEYRFRAGISAAELLDQVVAGHVIKYPLVIIEGWNFRQVMHAIESAPKLTLTLAGLTPAEIMSRLEHPGMAPEGRFFPDTYYYSQGQTDAEILAKAFSKMRTALEEEWNNRAADLPLNNMGEALVLASIVEKETARAEERPLIAGVFINRLREGMRLQSDPTVIYGLGERFDGDIRTNDLRADTPYNTYTRRGLPPTPIAMPGRKSLVAALHPADTRALYFVSRGDGSHVFSETLAEHSAAVAKYQLGGRSRNSAPSPGAEESGHSGAERK
jgi:peptidoglycan lytic transglycosylase G